MRIAFIGSSLVSAHWNGAATYYRGLVRALAARGHRVTFLEPDAFDRQAHRDIPDPEWARVVVWPATADGLARVADEAGTFDLVVKCSGVGVHDAELERLVAGLRGPGRLVAFLDVDAPATLERLARDPADPFRALIPQLDLVVVYGGGDAVIDAYRRLGARACVPVGNALDPATHHPVPPDPTLACDLAFLGNRLPDREARVCEFFLGPAERLPDLRFLIGGAGWEGVAMPANVRRLGHVPTADHNRLNCSARAVLNVNRDGMARSGFSPPTRIFEAAGAGACVVTDAWPGIETFFEPDREILVADGGDAVARHLRALTPARSAEIGAAARRRALAEHGYGRRARDWDAAVAGIRPATA